MSVVKMPLGYNSITQVCRKVVISTEGAEKTERCPDQLEWWTERVIGRPF
jgi:hypothetical protein